MVHQYLALLKPNVKTEIDSWPIRISLERVKYQSTRKLKKQVSIKDEDYELALYEKFNCLRLETF